MLNVLYLYSGSRKNKVGVINRDYPDTQFYGLNHLSLYNSKATYIEPEDYLGRPLDKILSFRVRHSLMFFKARQFDVVFGISVLYLVFWKKFIPVKTKFVLFNSVLVRMLAVHKQGSLGRVCLTWLLAGIDEVVFLDHYHRDVVIKELPNLENRSSVVLLGVDTVYFQPQYEGRQDFVLAVGRDNGRDYKTILEAAVKMPNQKFVIVCLPRNIESLGPVPNNVVVKYNIPQEELNTLYTRAKLLLLVTHDDTYIDGSDTTGPTVLVEAMASGLPVLATHRQYLDDYVVNNYNAWLIDFYDPNAIVSILTRVTSEECQKIARQARATVEAKLTTKHMAHDLSVIFNNVYKR